MAEDKNMDELNTKKPEKTISKDHIILGGSIELSGFKDLEPGELIVLKKIVGHFAEKFSKMHENFERLIILKKDVHKQEHSQKFEIQAKLLEGGKIHSVDSTEFNLFVALDSVMKKLEAISKKD